MPVRGNYPWWSYTRAASGMMAIWWFCDLAIFKIGLGGWMNRATRLLMLMRLLSQRSWTTAELAQRLEVSRQTIYRDLFELQLEPLCFPPVSEDGRWRRMAQNDR